MSDHYLVSFTIGKRFQKTIYGTARPYYENHPDFNRDELVNKAHAKGHVIVDDAVLPICYSVLESRLVDIPLMPPERPGEPETCPYLRHVAEEERKAQELSDSLGDKLAPGKLFSLGVADGSASYVVMRVDRRAGQCEIEWRGFGVDTYYDQVLGGGGWFNISTIAQLIKRTDGMRKLFPGPMLPAKLAAKKTRTRKGALARHMEKFDVPQA